MIFSYKVSSQNLDLASQWPVILEFEFGFLKDFCKNPNATVRRILFFDRLCSHTVLTNIEILLMGRSDDSL